MTKRWFHNILLFQICGWTLTLLSVWPLKTIKTIGQYIHEQADPKIRVMLFTYRKETPPARSSQFGRLGCCDPGTPASCTPLAGQSGDAWALPFPRPLSWSSLFPSTRPDHRNSWHLWCQRLQTNNQIELSYQGYSEIAEWDCQKRSNTYGFFFDY